MGVGGGEGDMSSSSAAKAVFCKIKVHITLGFNQDKGYWALFQITSHLR